MPGNTRIRTIASGYLTVFHLVLATDVNISSLMTLASLGMNSLIVYYFFGALSLLGQCACSIFVHTITRWTLNVGHEVPWGEKSSTAPYPR